MSEIPGVSENRQSQTESVMGVPQESSGEGISRFMGTWKMNDIFFLIVNENLTSGSTAWFSVRPDNVSQQLTLPVAEWTNQSEHQAVFIVSRAVPAAIHVFITMWQAAVAWRVHLRQLPRLVFLSWAWFWLLLPTLNPWYWIWAMPLLPFAHL